MWMCVCMYSIRQKNCPFPCSFYAIIFFNTYWEKTINMFADFNNKNYVNIIIMQLVLIIIYKIITLRLASVFLS